MFYLIQLVNTLIFGRNACNDKSLLNNLNQINIIFKIKTSVGKFSYYIDFKFMFYLHFHYFTSLEFWCAVVMNDSDTTLKL